MPILIGTEQKVNTYTTGSQGEAQITALADGGWVVTWTSEDQDFSSDGVYQRRYTSSGATYQTEIRVHAESTGHQSASHVASLITGGWVVTWLSHSLGNWYLNQRVFDKDGEPTSSSDLPVATGGANVGISSITGLSDGGWLVSWVINDDSGSGIYQVRYEANGDPVLNFEPSTRRSMTIRQALLLHDWRKAVGW
jgi:hypothetical protein